MLRQAAAAGVKRLYVHVLLDGRDVAPTSALTYVDRLEAVLGALRGRRRRRADRLGRRPHDHDHGSLRGRLAHRRARLAGPRARRRPPVRQRRRRDGDAIATSTPGIIDQDLPPFVIADDRGPVAPIVDGDGVVLFNFRGDRAIEITRAFDDAETSPSSIASATPTCCSPA
jgi:2,3-bisphosphoglycerate-independent phosphoglycerate mutase